MPAPNNGVSDGRWAAGGRAIGTLDRSEAGWASSEAVASGKIAGWRRWAGESLRSVVTTDRSDATEDPSFVGKDRSIVAKDTFIGTKDMSFGTKDMSIVTKDMSIVTKDMSIGAKDMSSETKDMSFETKDMFFATKDISGSGKICLPAADEPETRSEKVVGEVGARLVSGRHLV